MCYKRELKLTSGCNHRVNGGLSKLCVRSVCCCIYIFVLKNLIRRKTCNSFDLYNGNVFYSSNTTAKQNIASFVRLPRQPRPCSSLKNSTPNSIRVIVTCRLLTKASISLLLIQISNHVDCSKGNQEKGGKGCHWNIQHLTDSKFEERFATY